MVKDSRSPSYSAVLVPRKKPIRKSPLTAPGPLEAGDDLRADVMRGAIPPLVDAVSAIVVDGLIDPEDAEALSGPWRAVGEGNRRT